MNPPRDPGQRTVLSLPAILDASIALLDAGGEKALSFRRLAREMGTGVASVYWYVANRDELLARATGAVVERALLAADASVDAQAAPPDSGRDEGVTEPSTYAADAPLERIRRLARALFDQLDHHPWAGVCLMAASGPQDGPLVVFERMGAALTDLGLSTSEAFYGATALVNYVVGVGTQMGQARFTLAEPMSRQGYLDGQAARWRDLDPTGFPFVTAIADEFAAHDDETQFMRGLDLLLAGLAQQAEHR